jgi:hypothetical protein
MARKDSCFEYLQVISQEISVYNVLLKSVVRILVNIISWMSIKLTVDSILEDA